MSQAGEIDVIGNNPEIPTEFVTDNGTAVPIANTLEILGTSVAAGTTPVETTGSGNTVTIEVQTSQAVAATDATTIGLSNYNSSHFSVDANGFVSLSGGGNAIDSIHPDSGTDPVVPTSAGLVNIIGQDGISTVGSLNTMTITPRGAGTSNMFLGQLAGNATLSGTRNVSYGAGSAASLTTGSNNTFVGYNSGTPATIADNNVGVGDTSLVTLTQGGGNTAVGQASLQRLTTGSNNVAIGRLAINNVVTGDNNVAIGQNVATNLGNGSSNIIIGQNAASAYASTESSNIIIGNAGVVSESGIMRIGTSGTHTALFVAGTSYPVSTTINQLLYSSATNVISGLTSGNSLIAATNSSGTLAMRSLSTVIQTFTSGGTYTPTTGMLYCIIEVVGNGGGGGGVAATTGGTFAGAGGGGGGEYARGVFSAATIGANQTITFGATGTGGTAGANAGTSGGTVEVGALISAAGGTGGLGGGASTSTSSLGGAGGTGGSGGSFRSPGFIGSPSITSIGGAFLIGGMGGDSFFGAGANCSNTSAAGTSGLGYGSGGSGAVNSISQAARAGGDGATGIVVITEFVVD